MNLLRVRAVLGIGQHDYAPMIRRAHAMHDGMASDTATYGGANPQLPAFLTLIQNAETAQLAVQHRTVGAAAMRNAACALLYTGMESERIFVQILVDASPERGVVLIQNAGLLVAKQPGHTKAPLTLRNGVLSGTVVCDANVGLLVAAAGAAKPNQQRFFNWEYTLDGSKTFQSAPSTPKGKTILSGLTPATTVGVRVSMTNGVGQGAWSAVESIVVR